MPSILEHLTGTKRPAPHRPGQWAGFVAQPSPGRAEPADEHAWLPVPNVDSLPALEELLDENALVNSGQTEAVTDTQPVPAITPTRRERPPQRARRAPTRPPEPGRTARRRARGTTRRRLLVVALAVATVAALAFAIPDILPHSPAVTIRVDGKQRISAETDRKTVASVLREHNVRTGAEDRVTPGPGTKVSDGMTVNVSRAFPVVVDVDGSANTVSTTWAKPVELVRRQLHLDPKDVSIISAPTRLTQGSSVAVRTLHEVTISVDGTQQRERTGALTVSEFLQQNSVVEIVGAQVTPPAETRLADAMTVTVARIVPDTAQADEELPPPTLVQADPDLPGGQRREVQPGVAGKQRVTYQITKKDGREVARTPISKVPTQPPTPRIVAVGTAPPNTRTRSAS